MPDNPYLTSERVHSGDVARDHASICDLLDEHSVIVRQAELGARRGQDRARQHNFSPLLHALEIAQRVTHTVLPEVAGHINAYKAALDGAMTDHSLTMERYWRRLQAAGQVLVVVRDWLEEAKAGPTIIERAANG